MSKLKQVREQQNLTQEELSEKSGISVRTIQRIESGTAPKGHTLKTLSSVLNLSENDLLKNEEEIPPENSETGSGISFQKIKLINLSSILFVLVPPLNILAPLILSYTLKQRNFVTKQIISLQILWTILAPVFFMLGIVLKLGRSFTIVLLGIILLSNIFLILSNLAAIDTKQKLHYKLNFSIV